MARAPGRQRLAPGQPLELPRRRPSGPPLAAAHSASPVPEPGKTPPVHEADISGPADDSYVHDRRPRTVLLHLSLVAGCALRWLRRTGPFSTSASSNAVSMEKSATVPHPPGGQRFGCPSTDGVRRSCGASPERWLRRRALVVQPGPTRATRGLGAPRGRRIPGSTAHGPACGGGPGRRACGPPASWCR